ncbi:MAG: NIPSNAP family protein [Chitinophagaceae bacterium]|nr:NIPSNAP family protein [Chitinophagaceae bacterium]
MKYVLSVLLTLVIFSASANPPKQEFYELRIYQLSTEDQEERLNAYLKDALVPALHRAGITSVGVFKAKGNDTASIRKVVLLVPYKSLGDLDAIDTKLEKDKVYINAGADYINAAHNNPAYTRFSKTILKAFSGHPVLSKPALTGPRDERVYELRSYEGATEKLHRKKVDMFVKGDEIAIFNRLQFNAVFYGEVLAGGSMPNLMYMTSFDNKESRDAHWKAFVDDPEWKKLSGDKQYENTVSHIDSTFLEATDFSDL